MSEQIIVHAATADDMRGLGENIARHLQGGEVIVLSGPLGAGKTTLSQGIGRGLSITEPVVSPTFTIARELRGTFSNGQSAHLVHVDAYRLPGSDNDDALSDPQHAASAAVNRLLDELESLGLDEILEEPDDNTVILMEWGSMMASVLAPERLEILIDRSVERSAAGSGVQRDTELTSEGARTITLNAVGAIWQSRLEVIASMMKAEDVAEGSANRGAEYVAENSAEHTVDYKAEDYKAEGEEE